MARRRKSVPSYLGPHTSGQAYCRINGRNVYLGVYDSPESRANYAKLIGSTESSPNIRPLSKGGATINDVLARWWVHVKESYDPTGREPAQFRMSLLPLKTLFGHSPAAEFGPRSLKAVQTSMVTSGLCRNVVNRRITRIRTMFRWAESEELVPLGTFHGLCSLRGIPKNHPTVKHTDPITPSRWEDVEKVANAAPPAVGAMLKLQWITGMRTCEVVAMRTRDIDQSNPVWVYRPSRDKNRWREQSDGRAVPLGPQAIEIVRPWLRPDQPDGCIFRALADRLRPGKEPRYRDSGYKTFSYAQAVRRACAKTGVVLTPYQGRHAAKRRIARAAGDYAARQFLGHRSLGSTAKYDASIDLEHASELARKYG